MISEDDRLIAAHQIRILMSRAGCPLDLDTDSQLVSRRRAGAEGLSWDGEDLSEGPQVCPCQLYRLSTDDSPISRVFLAVGPVYDDGHDRHQKLYLAFRTMDGDLMLMTVEAHGQETGHQVLDRCNEGEVVGLEWFAAGPNADAALGAFCREAQVGSIMKFESRADQQQAALRAPGA